MNAQSGKFTQELIRFIMQSQYEDLPDDVVKKTKQLILDTIGSALGGYVTDLGFISREVVRTLGGTSESTVIGNGTKTSCVNAAFVNAKMANALDCDDVFNNSAHFASPTIASALAVAERVRATGKEVLTAVALGYDATARVGLSCIGLASVNQDPSDTKIRLGSFAWHIVGSIIASAKLLRLDEKGMLNAFGIGCANAPITCLRKSWPTTMVKYGDMGVMAGQGILSSLLAKMGHTGSEDILDGDCGFWRYMGAENFDYDQLCKKLGKKWHIMDSAIKLYPSCRWIHPSLDLFREIVTENKLKPEEIDKVIVKVHRRAVKIVNIFEPEDWLAAQVSLPYNLALIAYGVPPSSEWQSPEKYNDPEILKFHRKVKVEEDPAAAKVILSADQPHYGFRKGSSSIEVTAKGKKFINRAEYAKGDPWLEKTKMTEKELQNKFRLFAARIAEPSLRWRKRIEEIIDKVKRLEKIENISELTEILYP